MAIKTISLENFRGQTKTVKVFNNNVIYGRNGSGKSSLREAICFTFCGRDSVGTRNPSHLISKDKESMKVIIETDKSTVSRTLSRKGASTIKIERHDTSNTFTQTQFEELVGKPDTFMSAMIPGFFFELDSKLKQSVLEDILPKIDKIALLEEIAGVTLTAEEKLRYGFNRRSDLVAASVAQDRRTIESEIYSKQGRIAQLSESFTAEEPKIEDKSLELQNIALAQELWAAYDRDIKLVNDRKATYERILAENNYINKRRNEIEEKLASLVKVVRPDYNHVDTTDLQETILPMPAKPTAIADIDSEHCSACGQTVSPKYREHVKIQNKNMLAKWEQDCEMIEKHNKSIRAEIIRINQENEDQKKAYLQAVEENRKREANAMALSRELANLHPQELPELLEAPPIPEVLYDKTAHLSLLAHQDKFKSEWAVYNHKKKEFETAKVQIDKLNAEIAEMSERSERYRKIEESLKTLPAIETQKQLGSFNTDKLVFDGENIIFDGTPLKMLSTGERAKVQIYFCRKISSMMAKPHGILFIDDADVIDDNILIDSPAPENEQVFKVYVKDTDMELVNGL